MTSSSSSGSPSAPWRLVGECVLAWARPWRAPARALLPEGIRMLPGLGSGRGWAAVVAVRYDQSPVGPYHELSVAVPARVGLRPGLCVVYQVVSSADAARAYRVNWGLPTEVGAVTWESPAGAVDGGVDARGRRVARVRAHLDRLGLELELSGAGVGPRWPSWVPVRSVQRRSDGPVVLPRRFLAWTRLASTTIDVSSTTTTEPPASPADGGGRAGALLSSLAGRHPGAVMTGVHVVAAPARHPLGLWSSLRAPLQVAEPVFLTADRRPWTQPLQLPPARALSSVG